MRLPLAILFLIVAAGRLAAEQPSGPSPRHQTQVFPLMNVPAKAAADAIGNYLKAKHDLEKLQDATKQHAEFMITPKIDTNSLVIKAEKNDLDEIKALVKKLDRSPDQIVIQMVISQMGPEGKNVTLSRPRIVTLHGQKAEIEMGSEDSLLRIELTPRVIREENEVKE